jgi:hypothetical protein
MDETRYLKHQIKSVVGLKSAIESCKGTITLMSDGGHLHFAFRHPAKGDNLYGNDRIFVYSPTTHGCEYIGEFTGFNFRFTKKSEVTKYSAEYRGIQYLQKIINREIPSPKLKIYIDTDSFEIGEDFYADKVFNHRGIDGDAD